MISRRNIRVKVMQALYTLDRMGGELKPGEPVTILKKEVEQSHRLFIYLLYSLIEIARYSETDARNKASKHLPTAEDLSVNTKIAGNELMWKILEDAGYKKMLSDFKLTYLKDEELIRRIYIELTGTEQYKEYIAEQSRDKKAERDILEFIFTDLMLPSEDFTGHIEEHFINWDDDAEMMKQLVMNYLQRPNGVNFAEIISPDKWDFAKSLLQTVLEKKEVNIEMIKPKLNNWDADRIAALDLIIIQMGVCEFLYFETIPTRVTINEYIDLAKEYSTPQSGQFVNGILDNIHKELTAEDKIHKKTFKNSTL